MTQQQDGAIVADHERIAADREVLRAREPGRRAEREPATPGIPAMVVTTPAGVILRIVALLVSVT